MQREGFGSFTDDVYLYHLYHRGSLSGAEYLPSGLIRIDLRDNSWMHTQFDTPIGFPKALTEFSSQGIGIFIDHDKEIPENQAPDGNWAGGYIYKIDVSNPNAKLIRITDEKVFWHDLKKEGDEFYVFGFNGGNNLVRALDVNGNLGSFVNIGLAGGALEVVNQQIIVAPYGEVPANLILLDRNNLNQQQKIDLPSTVGKIHEITAVENAEGTYTFYLFHEEDPNIKNGLGYGPQGIFNNVIPSGVRTVSKFDFNSDGLHDLLINTNGESSIWINDGWGRMIEAAGVLPAGAFNVHIASDLLIWMGWRGATPQLGYGAIPRLDTRDAASALLKQIDSSESGVDIVSGPNSVALISDKHVYYLDWDGFASQASISIQAQYSFDRRDYLYANPEASKISNSIFVSAYIRSEDKTDFFSTGIERALFQDGFFAFDTAGNAGQAYRIYKAAFDRAPDLDGLGYWISVMDGGAALAEVAGGFIGSNEFQSRYGTASDTDFIRLLYENVLDRQPDAEGYGYWQDAMSLGLSREGLLIQFSESPENKSNVAGLIANGIEYTPFIS